MSNYKTEHCAQNLAFFVDKLINKKEYKALKEEYFKFKGWYGTEYNNQLFHSDIDQLHFLNKYCENRGKQLLEFITPKYIIKMSDCADAKCFKTTSITIKPLRCDGKELKAIFRISFDKQNEAAAKSAAEMLIQKLDKGLLEKNSFGCFTINKEEYASEKLAKVLAGKFDCKPYKIN